MKRAKVFGLLVLVVTLSACTGSTVNNNNNSVLTVQGGLSALSNHDYLGAMNIFCPISDQDVTNSQAAFGCALTKAIDVWASADAVALINTTGETPVDISTAIFSPTGFFALSTPNSFGTYAKQASVSLALPAAGYVFTSSNAPVGLNFLKKTLKQMIQQAITSPTAQQHYVNLSKPFEYIVAKLDIAKNDPNFTFVIPAAFFYTSSDVNIARYDVYAFSSGARSMLLGIKLLGKYNVNYDINYFADPNTGAINYSNLVDCLNGVPATCTTFGSLKSGVLNLQDLTPILDGLLSDGETFVSGMISSGPSTLFTSMYNTHSITYWNNTLTLYQQLKSSLDNGGMTTLTTIGTLIGTTRTVSVDLKAFMTTPFVVSPNYDPFVYSGSSIHFVPNFFNDYFAGSMSVI